MDNKKYNAMKKILIFLISIVGLAVTSFAEPVSDEQSGLKFELNESDSTATVSLLENKNLTNVVIPSQVTNDSRVYNVTKIGYRAFFKCASLSRVEIPNSVTEIGQQAFACCGNLASVDIPKSVNVIGQYAFGQCKSLSAIEIPDSTTTIVESAFFGCTSLASIKIPSSVTSIGKQAFADCNSLASIIVDKDNKVYDSRENCNAIIETKKNTLISGCKSTKIPNTVTVIGEFAFQGINLESFNIPNSVTKIQYGAVSSPLITKVVFPKTLNEVGEASFKYCENLKTVRVPEGCKIHVKRGAYNSFPDNCKIIRY